MNAKFKTLVLISLLLLTLIFSACGAAQASDDELILKIGLDLDEEIGLLIIDWELGSESGSGGISNADKSMLSPGEPLDFSFDKSQFENVKEPFDLTLNFTISTEYFEPNFENDYPEEYLIRLEPVSFEAAFGNTYNIAIIGNEKDGYSAHPIKLDAKL